jgi:hypothetical protein
VGNSCIVVSVSENMVVGKLYLMTFDCIADHCGQKLGDLTGSLNIGLLGE